MIVRVKISKFNFKAFIEYFVIYNALFLLLRLLWGVYKFGWPQDFFSTSLWQVLPFIIMVILFTIPYYVMTIFFSYMLNYFLKEGWAQMIVFMVSLILFLIADNSKEIFSKAFIVSSYIPAALFIYSQNRDMSLIDFFKKIYNKITEEEHPE